MAHEDRSFPDRNEAKGSQGTSASGPGPSGRSRRSRRSRHVDARKKDVVLGDAEATEANRTSQPFEKCEPKFEVSCVSKENSEGEKGSCDRKEAVEADVVDVVPKASPRWWSKLRGSDPITLDPLRKLNAAPFKLKAGEGSRVCHYFDAEVLAQYLVSSGQFCHPITRRPLSRKECGALDKHLKSSGLDACAIVTRKYDLVLEQKKKEEANGDAQGAPSTDEERRSNREEEARELLEQLYVEGPTRQTRTRRAVRESHQEYRQVEDASMVSTQEDYPELPNQGTRTPLWPTLAQSRRSSEPTRQTLQPPRWPALWRERVPTNSNGVGSSTHPAELEVSRSELGQERPSRERPSVVHTHAVMEAQGMYSARSLRTALTDPSRAYALEEEVESFILSGKKRYVLAPADARWREVGHVLCESRGLTSCSLGNGSARRIHIFRGVQINQSYQTLNDAMHKALEIAQSISTEALPSSSVSRVVEGSLSCTDLTMRQGGIGDESLEGRGALGKEPSGQLGCSTSGAVSNDHASSAPGLCSSEHEMISDPWDSEAGSSQSSARQTDLAALAHESWEEMADACPGVMVLSPISSSENKWEALESEYGV